MKKLHFSAALTSLLLFCLSVFGQTNTRPVKGLVLDENGRLVSGVTIKTEQGETFIPNEDGSFDIRVHFHCRTLIFSAPSYSEVKMEVDGSYMYVRLKFDKAAKEKARKDAEAATKAEQAQKAREEKERLAAEEKARKEAEAKAKADEKARRKAEKDAHREAEAKAWAEEEAELERQAAEEKARKEAKAKAKAEMKAIRKSQK